jgi:hypothetical protein
VTGFDSDAIERETKFLLDNPHFKERPASILEFLDTGYLEISKRVRPGIKQALVDIFGNEVNPHKIAIVQRSMLTGAIGIGKTTFSSIAIPYMVHWVACLEDPQGWYDLLPGSRIAFMQMSTSEDQAKEVVFGDIKARINHSPWFIENLPMDPAFKNQIRFPGDIWVLPGDSAETTFEGYNILGGILDEADSHKKTKEKDYAEVGYDTINSRIESRFEDQGLIIVIGQMKRADGFAARKYKEFKKDPQAHTVRMTIWESLGWERFTKDGKRDSFWYDARRKEIIPTGVAGLVKNDNLIEVPNIYLPSFRNNPEKALRDLAGIPPSTEDPFISLVSKIDAARDRWIADHGDESPVGDNPSRPEFAKWFTGAGDPRKRVIHLDLAYSADGDALGFAMGHVSKLVEREDELKPYITIDCLVRWKAMPGTEIFLQDVRRIIYDLKDERKFRIIKVTMDGFQSTDTRQQLQKKRFLVDNVSVDKSTLAYEDLRDALYEDRIEFPPYMTYINKGDVDRVEILPQELMGLTHDGRKVDHPPDGSKDVADAVAGVTVTLMGDRMYRKGVVSLDAARERREQRATGTTGTPESSSIFSPGSGLGLQAPIPPTGGSGAFGLAIPKRLQP